MSFVRRTTEMLRSMSHPGIIKRMPNFSVILPTYNRAPFLGRAIDSVLDQTYQDLELIVINDGSTDETASVLDEATRDARVRVIEQGQAGPAVARNSGLELAMGRLITYIDSDNIWYPDHLSTIDDELRPPYVAAYTGQNLFLIGGNVNEQKVIGRKTRSSEYNPTTFQRMNYVDIGCLSHRVDILETVGDFGTEVTWGEDWDFIARIALHYPYYVKHIDQVTGAYNAYLPEVIPTMTNQIPGWEDGIKMYFGLGPTQSVDKKITQHIATLVREQYPYPGEV